MWERKHRISLEAFIYKADIVRLYFLRAVPLILFTVRNCCWKLFSVPAALRFWRNFDTGSFALTLNVYSCLLSLQFTLRMCRNWWKRTFSGPNRTQSFYVRRWTAAFRLPTSLTSTFNGDWLFFTASLCASNPISQSSGLVSIDTAAAFAALILADASIPITVCPILPVCVVQHGHSIS